MTLLLDIDGDGRVGEVTLSDRSPSWTANEGPVIVRDGRVGEVASVRSGRVGEVTLADRSPCWSAKEGPANAEGARPKPRRGCRTAAALPSAVGVPVGGQAC